MKQARDLKNPAAYHNTNSDGCAPLVRRLINFNVNNVQARKLIKMNQLVFLLRPWTIYVLGSKEELIYKVLDVICCVISMMRIYFTCFSDSR